MLYGDTRMYSSYGMLLLYYRYVILVNSNVRLRVILLDGLLANIR